MTDNTVAAVRSQGWSNGKGVKENEFKEISQGKVTRSLAQ